MLDEEGIFIFSDLKYLKTALTNQNYILYIYHSRLNSKNSCSHLS